MLPGFRFIVMTLLLATSVLIFGLGAAALLRATHEEFASVSSLRTPEKQLPATFAERFNPTGSPTLSLLRVDSPAQETAEPDRAAAKDANVANLGEHHDAKSLQSAQDDEPAARPRARRRLTQARRSRIRITATQKRRLPGRRITLTGIAQKSSADTFPPQLFSNQ